MATKKGGLGKGLGSLFIETSGDLEGSGKDAQTIPINEIERDANQPRKTFQDEALTELSKSIEERGVLQPIMVRPNPAGGYKIVMGERRWRASKLAGLKEIPAVVREISDEEAYLYALIENLQRQDLDPIEEAMGYKRLMEEGDLTQEQVAEQLKLNRSTIANSLRLLSLPDDVLEMLKNGELSTGHAKAVLSIPNSDRQSVAARQIIEEKMNVRKAEALAKKLQKEPKGAAKTKSRPSIAAEVEISLRETLGAEVNVDYQDGKGVLKIGFYSDEQLLAFANLLGQYEADKTVAS